MTPEEELEHRFPEMKPIKKSPSLHTINGIGTAVYGRRDFDPETGTYIKNHCFTFVFIPLVVLGSYRVADAEQGWYFIGREPMSMFSRIWNTVIAFGIACLAIGIAWSIHTDSPEYRAGQLLAEARDQAAEGQPMRAAWKYAELLRDHRHHHAEARAELAPIAQNLLAGEPEQASGMIRLLISTPGSPEIAPGLAGRGLELVESLKASAPRMGLEVLDSIAGIAPTNANLPAIETRLLERLVERDEAELPEFSWLALSYEEAEAWDKCVSVLEPRADRLGDSEAARVLGQLMMSRHDYEAAYALLSPYVEGRMAKMRTADEAYQRESEAAYQRGIDYLNSGNASQTFYRDYEAAGSDAEKEKLVDEIVIPHMEADAVYRAAVTAYREAAAIVPVVLDLGIARLNRAQGLTDPAARKAELEGAERTFLSIQTAAGETDEYRMFLGQVYYWLGKSGEGSQLFDELLDANARSPKILVSLSSTLRDLGERKRAREFSEEAYEGAENEEERFAAARMRALCMVDLDDEIHWLERADTNSTEVVIQLATSKGHRARQNGNEGDAAVWYRQAIDGYKRLQRSASTLNNSGLVHLSYYQITGDAAYHRKGAGMMAEAVALMPGDSILLNNAAVVSLDSAILELAGERLDIAALGGPDLSMVAFLYANESGRRREIERLASLDLFKTGMEFLNKALVLAPKRVDGYQRALAYHEMYRDVMAIRQLQTKFEAEAIDFSDDWESLAENLAGEDDSADLKVLEARVEQARKRLERPNVREHDATFAVAATSLVALELARDRLGVAPDYEALVPLAREANQRHPCRATFETLLGLHLARLHDAIRRQDDGYRRWAGKSRRVIPGSYLIALAAGLGGERAGRITSHPDFQRALEVLGEKGARYPTLRDSMEWALLRHSNPGEAARVAETLIGNEARKLAAQLGGRLNPASATKTLEAYWWALMSGDSDSARKLWEQKLQRGLPLPSLSR